MRRLALCTMVASFVLLGVIDLWEGKVRTGAASLLLATVQALLFM